VAADQCDSPEDNSPTASGSPTRITSGLPTGSPGTDEALSFNGSNYYYQDDSGGDANNLDFNGSDFTIGCWVKLDASGWSQSFFSKYNWTPSGYGWQISVTSDPYGQGLVDLITEPTSTSISTGTWYHLVQRWDDATDEVEVFLNGEPDCDTGCASESTGATASTYDFVIGAYDGGGEPVGGDAYECLAFSEAFTNLEICEWCRHGGRGNATDRGAGCGSCTWF
jgi:hypothetical protein